MYVGAWLYRSDQNCNEQSISQHIITFMYFNIYRNCTAKGKPTI